MLGETLHAFDLVLSHYVADNIAARLPRPAFAAFVRKVLSPPLADYLAAHAEAAEDPDLLLSDGDLEELALTFAAAPFQHDLPWAPYEARHRLHIGCVPEVRSALAPHYADEWARLSARCAKRLETGHVLLHRGIEVIREWAGELRRYLRAMSATAFLPQPEGRWPTPTSPERLPALPASEVPGPHAATGTDALLHALTETQALQREVRDLLLSQRTVKDWYGTEELAQLLGKAEFTVREWCRLGRVRAEKRGSGRGKFQSWVVSHAELQRIQREGLLPVQRPR
jgi:hypothetical protein